MKGLLLTTWIIFVIVTTVAIWRRNPAHTTYRATRPLTANHRIVAEDLDPPPDPGCPLLGKYVRDKQVGEGAIVRPETLITYPRVQISEGRRPVAVPLSPHIARAINADSIVDVWAGPECILSGVSVLAVTCDAPSCAAIFAAEEPQATKLAENKTNLQLLIRTY